MGLELGDPEELVGQMSAQRRASLRGLGRELDELEAHGRRLLPRPVAAGPAHPG